MMNKCLLYNICKLNVIYFIKNDLNFYVLSIKYMDKNIENLLNILEKKDFKNKLIKQINNNINIPILNEKTEKKIYDEIYDTILNTIKKHNF